jgi:competence protein ComGC
VPEYDLETSRMRRPKSKYDCRATERVMMMVIIIIIIIIIITIIPENHEVKELQKTVILGTAHMLRKVLM